MLPYNTCKAEPCTSSLLVCMTLRLGCFCLLSHAMQTSGLAKAKLYCIKYAAAALSEACIHTYIIKPSLQGNATVVEGPSLPKVTHCLFHCGPHFACFELLPTPALLC